LLREDDEEEPDFLPPRLEAPGELAIFAARSFDIPFSFSFSYCLSFLTLGRLPGIASSFPVDAGATTVRGIAIRLRVESRHADSRQTLIRPA
jgi:hypothetical protein